MELVNDNENGEAPKCENFSIRGYVAEVSKQHDKMCWPFAKVDGCKGLEQQAHELPPLRVAEFRWWGCENCVRRIVGVTKETGEVAEPSPGRLELINHSHVDAFTFSHMDAPMGPSGSPQEAKDCISEGRKNEAYADMNVNEYENENLSPANDVEEKEAAIEPTKRDEDSLLCKGHDDVVEDMNRTVLETVCVAATTDKPMLTEGGTMCLDETNIRIKSNKHQFGIYAHETSVSSKFVPDKDALETVSLNPNGEKRKQKKIINSAAEIYLDVNPGCKRKGVIKRKKKLRQERSDCGAATGNMDIDESDERSENEHENSGVTSQRIKVRKVRTLVDILKTASSVVCVKDTGMDLNLYPVSPMPIDGSDANVSLGKNGKRKITQTKDEGSLHKNDEMFSCGKNTSKLPRVEDRRSAFLPWNEQFGFQIGRCDAQNTEPRAFSGGDMPHVGCAGYQFHQPEASSGTQNYKNSNIDRHPKVTTCRTSEPTITDEMEIVALLASNKHQRRLSNTEGTARNSSDNYSSHASMGLPAFSFPLPNYMPFGTNSPNFVGGSSKVHSVAQPFELCSHKETEKNYGLQPVGQLDLFANDIIPATHLLRLMDAGARTNTSLNAERRRVTELPLLPHEHRLPPLPGLDLEQSKNSKASMLPPTWNFNDNTPRVQCNNFRRDSGPRKNSSNKLMSDVFKSQKKEKVERKNNLMSDAFKFQKKEKAKWKNVPLQSRSVRAAKCVSRDEISIEGPRIEEGYLSVSAPMLFPAHGLAMDSATSVELDLNKTDGTEICSLNRNPADFSLPEPGNKYMIKY